MQHNEQAKDVGVDVCDLAGSFRPSIHTAHVWSEWLGLALVLCHCGPATACGMLLHIQIAAQLLRLMSVKRVEEKQHLETSERAQQLECLLAACIIIDNIGS